MQGNQRFERLDHRGSSLQRATPDEPGGRHFFVLFVLRILARKIQRPADRRDPLIALLDLLRGGRDLPLQRRDRTFSTFEFAVEFFQFRHHPAFAVAHHADISHALRERLDREPVTVARHAIDTRLLAGDGPLFALDLFALHRTALQQRASFAEPRGELAAPSVDLTGTTGIRMRERGDPALADRRHQVPINA
nr:hypothetical protein [Burkholderia stabilis]